MPAVLKDCLLMCTARFVSQQDDLKVMVPGPWYHHPTRPEAPKFSKLRAGTDCGTLSGLNLGIQNILLCPGDFFLWN